MTSAKTLALTDRVLAALDHDLPRTAREIAQLVGHVACRCVRKGYAPGTWPQSESGACWCLRGSEITGWQRAGMGDVRPILNRLEAAGVVVAFRADGRVAYALAAARVDDGLRDDGVQVQS